MPKYKYTAVDVQGNNVYDTIFASDMAEFNAILKQKGEFCLNVKQLEDDDRRGKVAVSSLGLKDLSVLCKQFATMLNAGITIVKSLDVLYRQAEKKKIRDILLNIYEQVQTGKSLSEAMGNTEGAFPDFMISMIEAGEMSGSLDIVMNRLATHYEKELKIRSKVTSAMIYPIILCVVGISVVFVLFTFVMPNLMDMFDKENLPTITKVLFAISNIMRTSWPILLMGIGGIGVGLYTFKGLKPIKMLISKFKIFLPGFGKLNIKIMSSAFCRTMSSVFSSGMSLITSLELTANCLNNAYVSERMSLVIDDIRSGSTLSASLSKMEVFPQMMLTMISVGEESGALDEVLSKTSDFYDLEADDAIQKMVTLLEPLMIVGLGLIVGVVVIGIMAPIYGMYDNIQ